MLDLLCALVLGLSAPLPLPNTPDPPIISPSAETRAGKIVLYGPTWGDWTCDAAEKCGIAARQNVRLAPGEWCVATWYREDRNRTGTLQIGSRVIRIRVCDYANPLDLPEILEKGIAGEIPWLLAREIPGMTGAGWVTGTLTLGPIVSTMPPVCGTRIPRCSSTPAVIAATTSRPLPQPW